MTVKKETAQIRPFVVCAILRNVPRALVGRFFEVDVGWDPGGSPKKTMERSSRSVLERAVQLKFWCHEFSFKMIWNSPTSETVGKSC